MPTLRPQLLSGLVVIPTVEHDPGIYRVSIAIDVGMSRTPPPQVVNREDLIVELRNTSDGSLEPIASPDPGPLPVRALRVIQARGEFTYGQGLNPATELVVTVRGDRKTFPMSQTFAPTRCLGREPKEGDPFPATRPAPPPVASIGARLPRLAERLPQILLPFRPGCCIRRFEAPSTQIIDEAVKSAEFAIEGDFSSRGRRCRCKCCEYRQFVRGTFTDAGGNPVQFDMPSGPLSPTSYCEDGAVDEFGPGKPGYYGHRDTSTAGDEYGGGPGAAAGCTYRGREASGCPPTETAHLEFLGLIVDRCRNRVVATRTWTIDL
jgi:hypothetical protein